MKIVIDKKAIEAQGLSADEFILIMVLYNKIDLEGAAKSLKRRGLANIGADPPYYISIKQTACDKYDDAIVAATDYEKEKDDYTKLAEKLIDIYPKGWKDGKYIWAEGPILIAKRLKMFELKYGVFQEEDIVNATQKYVDTMYGKDEMRVLKYFIYKEKENSAGENESTSDLYTLLVNKDDTLFQAEEWKAELK